MQDTQALTPLRYVEFEPRYSLRVELAQDNTLVRISQTHIGGDVDIKGIMAPADVRRLTEKARELLTQATRPVLPGSEVWRKLQFKQISLGGPL